MSHYSSALLLSKLLFSLVIICAITETHAYKVGVAIADCTGPAAGITFMGYAKAKQKGCGIHLRQFARAFIIEDDAGHRVGFVSVDAAMMGHGVRKAVLAKLHYIHKITDYNMTNLILSGTHTHSTPGGFLMDLLLDIPTRGFIRETFDVLVTGITKAIIRAHHSMLDAEIYITSGELHDANINRSPTAYLLNPLSEREKYRGNVDKEMMQLQIRRMGDGSLMGAINWFAVHPTSMNNTNCLVSSDNVGYASILLEQSINHDASLLGKGPFVGAFAATNLGDVSPNLQGPHCVDSGESCDANTSSCPGGSQLCIASGPGKDMFDSTRIIARRLFNKAQELILDEEKRRLVKGPVKFVHQFVDMPEQTATVEMSNGTVIQVKGCLPAMGYSFAAGTTDGPGEFDFTQGTLSTNIFWNIIRDFIFPPTKEDIACQHPKPILLNTGRISTPYEWQPQIVSTQLIQIGEVILIAVPGEFTTMAGRRLRNVIKGAMPTSTPIIAGLSNVYSSYITTPEEYQAQRYEGASTIYGPYTLSIYLEQYARLARHLTTGEAIEPGPSPPDFSTKLISLVGSVKFDTAGWRHNYGDCIKQPPTVVRKGDTVEAMFVAGHPRNDLMQGRTFLTIERYNGEDHSWRVVATDANWETRFIWKKTSHLFWGSEATIQWEIPDEMATGTYRIRHFGHYKYIFGGIYPYNGSTRNFQIE